MGQCGQRKNCPREVFAEMRVRPVSKPTATPAAARIRKIWETEEASVDCRHLLTAEEEASCFKKEV